MHGSSVSACVLAALAAFAPAVTHAQIIPIVIPSGPCSSSPASPRFSVRPGAYPSPLAVRLSDNTRGAVIFYTTDGWTPTALSPRYAGPIAITATTTLQAIAVVPNCSTSSVAGATYTLPAAPPSPPPSAVVLPALPTSQGTLILRADAQIPLAFASAVDSRTAQVGDPIAFTLTQDLKIGDAILAPKGASAVGKVIQVDRSGVGDQPAQIQFQVDSLDLDKVPILLHATDAFTAGKPPRRSTSPLAIVSSAGLSLLLTHGKEARISAGTPLTATLSAGTILPAPGASPGNVTGADSPGASPSPGSRDPR